MKGSAYSIFYIDNENNIVLSNGDVLLDEPEPENINAIKALTLEKGLRKVVIGGKQYITESITSDITSWKLVYLAPLNNILCKAGFVSTITFSILSA